MSPPSLGVRDAFAFESAEKDDRLAFVREGASARLQTRPGGSGGSGNAAAYSRLLGQLGSSTLPPVSAAELHEFSDEEADVAAPIPAEANRPAVSGGKGGGASGDSCAGSSQRVD